MKFLILLLSPFVLMAQNYSLLQLISYATTHHQQLKARDLQVKSATSQIESVQSSFYPTIDISANYTGVSPNSIISPRDTTTGVIAISYDIYDGGRKDAMLRAKQFEHQASQFEKDAFAKSIILD